MLLGKDRIFSFTFENGCPVNGFANDVVPYNHRVTLDFSCKIVATFWFY